MADTLRKWRTVNSLSIYPDRPTIYRDIMEGKALIAQRIEFPQADYIVKVHNESLKLGKNR
jgi:hypothetical protein